MTDSGTCTTSKASQPGGIWIVIANSTTVPRGAAVGLASTLTRTSIGMLPPQAVLATVRARIPVMIIDGGMGPNRTALSLLGVARENCQPCSEWQARGGSASLLSMFAQLVLMRVLSCRQSRNRFPARTILYFGGGNRDYYSSFRKSTGTVLTVAANLRFTYTELAPRNAPNRTNATSHPVRRWTSPE